MARLFVAKETAYDWREMAEQMSRTMLKEAAISVGEAEQRHEVRPVRDVSTPLVRAIVADADARDDAPVKPKAKRAEPFKERYQAEVEAPHQAAMAVWTEVVAALQAERNGRIATIESDHAGRMERLTRAGAAATDLNAERSRLRLELAEVGGAYRERLKAQVRPRLVPYHEWAAQQRERARAVWDSVTAESPEPEENAVVLVPAPIMASDPAGTPPSPPGAPEVPATALSSEEPVDDRVVEPEEVTVAEYMRRIQGLVATGQREVDALEAQWSEAQALLDAHRDACTKVDFATAEVTAAERIKADATFWDRMTGKADAPYHAAQDRLATARQMLTQAEARVAERATTIRAADPAEYPPSFSDRRVVGEWIEKRRADLAPLQARVGALRGHINAYKFRAARPGADAIDPATPIYYDRRLATAPEREVRELLRADWGYLSAVEKGDGSAAARMRELIREKTVLATEVSAPPSGVATASGATPSQSRGISAEQK